MKILITGGNGYIGAKLALALKEKGHDVKIFDKPKDIRNVYQFEEDAVYSDIVFHLAALAELKYTDAHPQETYEVNIEGTNNVARICSKHKILLNFVSTCCIYGNPLEKLSHEDGLINPSDTYAMSKAAGEYLVKMWGLAEGLKYNILRFGTVYGQSTNKDMRSDMCIQKFIKAAVEHDKIEITGDGNQTRNFIHIDDLVRALVLLAESTVVGETINFPGRESTSINEIAEYAVEMGAGPVYHTENRKDDFYEQHVSFSKANKLLGWEPLVKFEDGIKQMYKDYALNHNTSKN